MLHSAVLWSFRYQLPGTLPEQHSHDSHEWILVEHGRVEQHLGEQRCILEPGSVVFLPQGLRHIHRALTEPSRLLVVALSDANWAQAPCGTSVVLTHQALAKYHSGQGLPCSEQTRRSVVQAWGELPQLCRDQSVTARLNLFAAYSAGLAALTADPSMTHLHRLTDQSSDPAIEACCDWMRRHFRDHISIETLSQRAHLGRSEFHRRFKQHTGESPIRYLNTLRCQAASELFTTSSLTVLAIAQRCGFRSASHFYSCYKEIYGRSPRRSNPEQI